MGFWQASAASRVQTMGQQQSEAAASIQAVPQPSGTTSLKPLLWWVPPRLPANARLPPKGPAPAEAPPGRRGRRAAAQRQGPGDRAAQRAGGGEEQGGASHWAAALRPCFAIRALLSLGCTACATPTHTNLSPHHACSPTPNPPTPTAPAPARHPPRQRAARQVEGHRVQPVLDAPQAAAAGAGQQTGPSDRP